MFTDARTTEVQESIVLTKVAAVAAQPHLLLPCCLAMPAFSGASKAKPTGLEKELTGIYCTAQHSTSQCNFSMCSNNIA